MTTILNLISGSSVVLGALPGVFSWRLRFQKDDKLLSSNNRNLVESKIKELAQKLELNKPIELIEKKGMHGTAQAQGIALFSGRIGVAIDPEIFVTLPETQIEFVLAHELAHIKANDHLWMMLSGLIGTITTLAMSILFPSSAICFSSVILVGLIATSPAALVAVTVSLIALIFISKWREECADRLGWSVCSEDAQKDAPKFFEKIRIENLELRNHKSLTKFGKLLMKCLTTEDGGGSS
jgi:Zn-dependent protease with chaperone function